MMGESSWMRLPPPHQQQRPWVRTVFGSSKNVVMQPTFGRNQSCPATDFSVASTITNQASSSTAFESSTTGSASCSITTTPTTAMMDDMDALILGCAEDDYSLSSPTAAASAAAASSSTSYKMLGERRRRRNHVYTSSNPSVSSSNGSTSSLAAGQSSSLVSAGTKMTVCSSRSSSYSYTGSETCHVRKHKSLAEASRKLSQYTGADDGASCCSIRAEDAFRRRNVVKEELKYVIGFVSAPIKKIPLLKKAIDPNVELERKGGCLT